MPVDPIVQADELCELLGRAGSPAQAGVRSALLRESGDKLDEVIGELSRRGRLGALLSDGDEEVSDVLLSGALGAAALTQLAEVLVSGRGEQAAGRLSRLILGAEQKGHLPALFLALIAGGRYEPLRALLCDGDIGDSPALRALAAARPSYGAGELNARALSAARAKSAGTRSREARSVPWKAEPGYDLLIVPGYTPLDAAAPLPIEAIPVACRRVEQALVDYQEGLAPRLLLTGGAVHPPGTPYNEALMMRARLLSAGVPESALLVDPHARHSTTNLRNAGRLLRRLGLRRGLIVTGFDAAVFSQAFYFSHPTLSTFHARCRSELGYTVGELIAVDDHHVAFEPAADVDRPGYGDPLDF